MFFLLLLSYRIKIKTSLVRNSFDPTLINRIEKLLHISFGNWVGGDRDGHPLVTAKSYKGNTFRIKRYCSESNTKSNLLNLASHLSLSDSLHSVPHQIKSIHIEEWSNSLGELGKRCISRNPNEP